MAVLTERDERETKGRPRCAPGLEPAINTCWLTVYAELNRRMEARLSERSSLTLTQYRTLLELQASGGKLASVDLSQRLIIKGSAVVAALNFLESRGLVTRAAHSQNRRTVMVSLTSDGAEATMRASQAVKSVLDDSWDGLTEKQTGLIIESTRYAFGAMSGRSAVSANGPVQPFYATAVVATWKLWSRVVSRKVGMSMSEFRVLQQIEESGGISTPSETARALALTPAAVTFAVRKMSKAGLVRCIADDDDHRRHPITITNKGHAAAAAARNAISNVNSGYYAGMDGSAVEELSATAKHIYNNFVR